MSLSFRPIRPTDDAAVASIIRTVMPEFGADGPGFAIHDPEVDHMAEAYGAPGAGYFVVVDEADRVLGGGGFARLDGADEGTCELRKMYFLKQARGTGAGERLLRFLIEAARVAGYRTMYLETLTGMDAAMKLYTKLGFKPLCAPMGATGHTSCDRWYARSLSEDEGRETRVDEINQQHEWSDLQDELKDALGANDFDRAQRALNKGADPNGLDEDGTTPLFWAAFGNDLQTATARVKWLLEAGASVTSEKPDDGLTSVHTSAESGNVESLVLLLKYDGKEALGEFDYICRTPLICAVHNGHHQAARLLIASGSDVNAHDESRIDNSALSWAVENNDEEMVKLLLEAGADPAIRGWMQLDAVDRAEGKPRIYELLMLGLKRLNSSGRREPKAGSQP